MRCRRGWRLGLVVVVAVALFGMAGCGGDLPTTSSFGEGNPRRGAQVLRTAGCGACHTHSGVEGMDGRVAPPLDDFHQRRFVAGVLLNDFDNLVTWILAPQSVSPGNGMPNPGITPEEASDIAAFLLHQR